MSSKIELRLLDRHDVALALRCNRRYSHFEAPSERLFIRFPPPPDAVTLKRSSV